MLWKLTFVYNTAGALKMKRKICFFIIFVFHFYYFCAVLLFLFSIQYTSSYNDNRANLHKLEKLTRNANNQIQFSFK